MQFIIKANKNIIGIMGKHLFDKDAKYRLNYFCITQHIDEKFVLFNNMTKTMVELDSKEENLLTDFLEKNSLINSENKYLINELLKNWILVKADFNEVKVFDQIKDIYLEIYNSHKNKRFNNFTILPTTNCNARCYYCYEKGAKKISMNEQIANDTAQFIINNNLNYTGKVAITWFGGEPLLGAKNIDIICQALLENKIKFSSNFISNGYLFDDKTIKHAIKKWNLSRVQITLDGTEKNYNKIKSYAFHNKNKPINPFSIVIKNIEDLIKNNVYVKIRLNVSKDNFEDLKNLVEYLSQKFNKLKNKQDKNKVKYLHVYTHSIFQEMDDAYKKNDQDKKLFEKCYQRVSQLNKLIEEADLYARPVISTNINLNFCMADSGNCAIILPDGELGLCEHYCSNNNKYGSIYENKINEENINKWKEKYPTHDKCYTCPYYPTCLKLVNCPNTYRDCLQAEKEYRIQDMKNKIKNTYFNWLSNKKN